MKKLILLTAAILLATGASAQFSYGLKFGLNVANLTNTDARAKTSIYLGAVGEYAFNDYIGIQPEIVYSRQGEADKMDGVKYSTRFNYLNIPVLAKVYLIDRVFSLEVGPQFGFALNGREVSRRSGHVVKDRIPASTYKTFDFSIGMGLSYKFRWCNVSARYNLGITDVMKNNPGDKIRNSVFQIGLGWMF